MVVFGPAPAARMGACPCLRAGAAMLRGSLSARPLALQASGLAFGHPCAALGQCQASALSHKSLILKLKLFSG
ncbi:hypothetical protein FRY97_00820 [Phaeodactylibacter luteus]|uniref:Uncharacterized protein n=1 Tax=Phaeodactylibacter luteus TaxID=1564516 RepID=A0A5C6S7F1_9BACT|nr:hypothetical protein FRY97_00820 [Phaeodactylibacter luteus]